MSELPQCVSSDSLFELKHAERQKSIRFTDELKKRSVKIIRKESIPKLKGEDAHFHELWLSHRHRVIHMRSEVENKAPDYPWARRTGVSALGQNAVQFMERTKKNIQMLVEFSKTTRTHGVINPFRYERVYTMSSLPLSIKNLERIEAENHDIAKRIMDVVSEVDSGLKSKVKPSHHVKSLAKERRRRSTKLYSLNAKALAKYQGYNIHMPNTKKEQRLLLRPHIYLDIYLKDARPLGRIVIELYTAAAPVMVMELIHACRSKMHRKFVIKRLFPDLWLDVEMPLHSNSNLHQPLEYDAKIIDHGASACILSFRKDFVQGFRDNLSFSMSFRPLRVANGSRIGFGRIIEGAKIFNCLQSYGTKNGKLSRSIVFTGCGLL